MSRVARRLRRQRRDARRAARRERRSPAPGQDAQHPVEPGDSSAAPRTTSARHAAAPQAPRGASGGLALTVGLAIAALGAGSAAWSVFSTEDRDTGTAPVQTVETNYGGQPELCPAAPEGVSAERVRLESGGEDVLTATIQQADEGESAGVASSPCARPQRSQLFMGPETGSGADSVLTVTNPYDRPATVEVVTFGAEGDRGALGSTTVLVPSEEEREVSMSALAEGDEPFVVEVTASGAPVASSLRSSRASGSTSQGAELLPAQSAPEAAHTFAGVPMPEAGAETEPAELWLYAPASDAPGELTVELQVFGPDGQVILETPGVLTQQQGALGVVSIEGIEDAGVYDVLVRTSVQSGADRDPVPSYAAVRTAGDAQEVVTVVEQEPVVEWDPVTGLPTEVDQDPEEETAAPAPDFSWAASSAPVQPGDLMPAEADEAALHLFNPGEEDASVTLESGEQVEVPARSSTQIDLETGGDAAEIEQTSGEVHAAIILRDADGRFSVLGRPSVESDPSSVPVTLRR
ncbi:DUF5719 family protein [Nesterenkonia sp. NBAIMH1]|uniref:DUF5719 family protein n=1 Tax=Nesterenkonia sp. NBAIMH1 TaxID=2600320 RepID=UPI0011B417E1|nr:DUF5719 family protein [Nesterenkonia sp. NBAIMH1]